MDYLYAVLKMLSGLGVFLLGMDIMSENMKKLTNTKMKTLLNKANNKFVGVGIGAFTTAVVQSSGVTTVLVVGLVNVGIMSLYQATTIIMGSNIGTCVTGLLASLNTLNVSGGFEFAPWAMLLAFVGVVINMVSKKESVKVIASTIAGLGLVFVGLELVSGSMKIFHTSPFVTNALAKITNPLLLIVLGVVFTAIVQSSSAITTIIIQMAGAGLIIGGGGNSVLYIVLGSNIGSCVTAIISAFGVSTNAKRASLIHLMFNVFGTIIFTILLLCWKGFFDATFVCWFPNQAGLQIAMFHLFFNVACVVMFLPFTSQFVKLANLIIKDKPEKKETQYVKMDERIVKTPAIALTQLYNETASMLTTAMDAMTTAFNGFIDKNRDLDEKVEDKIEEVNKMHKEITYFLVKVSASDVNMRDEKLISALHYVLNDSARIGELAHNFTKYTKHYVEDELVFSDTVIEALKDMYQNILNLYELAKEAYMNKDKTLLKQVDNLEDEIDNKRRVLVNDHILRLKEGKCQPQSSGVFINLVGNLERAADHITFVAHSID